MGGTIVNPYQPFIDDPAHVGELDRQRFVVLRIPPAATDVHAQVRAAVRQRLTAQPVSYPARAHVTLCGFAAGAPLDAVSDLVTAWVRSVPPLSIEVEGMKSFPSPFQIVTVQVRKTPQLFAAQTSLRRLAEERRLVLSTMVPVDQWIFHMTVAYCAALSVSAWDELTRFVERLQVPSAKCVVGAAEVVAFDAGWEYSGGVIPLEGVE